MIEWGDFIEDSGTGLLGDVELLAEQMRQSIPLLQEFDPSKTYHFGWYIKEKP